jgi:hypothetical protein
LDLKQFSTASRDDSSTVRDDQYVSEMHSPIKKISQFVEKRKDKELSTFLRFTMDGDEKEDARTKMRKRDRLKT